MRNDTGDAYVPEDASDEWKDDIEALERSLNHLFCMFDERSEGEAIPSMTEAPAVMLKAA
jgi:hypothetical protein